MMLPPGKKPLYAIRRYPDSYDRVWLSVMLLEYFLSLETPVSVQGVAGLRDYLALHRNRFSNFRDVQWAVAVRNRLAHSNRDLADEHVRRPLTEEQARRAASHLDREIAYLAQQCSNEIQDLILGRAADQGQSEKVEQPAVSMIVPEQIPANAYSTSYRPQTPVQVYSLPSERYHPSGPPTIRIESSTLRSTSWKSFVAVVGCGTLLLIGIGLYRNTNRNTQILSQVIAIRPSFDCIKARSATEKLICRDVQLADLDRQMAEAYTRTVLSSVGTNRRRLQQRHAVWFRQFQRACNKLAGEPDPVIHSCVVKYLLEETHVLESKTTSTRSDLVNPSSDLPASASSTLSGPAITASEGSPDFFLGAWRNEQPTNNAVFEISIFQTSIGPVVHAWANYDATQCEWGDSSSASLFNSQLSADWNAGRVDHQLALNPQNDRLSALETDRYSDGRTEVKQVFMVRTQKRKKYKRSETSSSHLAVDLTGYCRAHGSDNASNFNGTGYGWFCMPQHVSISVDQACKEQHGMDSISSLATAPPGGKDDWSCIRRAP